MREFLEKLTDEQREFLRNAAKPIDAEISRKPMESSDVIVSNFDKEGAIGW
jgi:hypothetical protein